ncbi:MAG TPA: M50 family metallopeptidase, partial [Fervidobacterium sp.]|nr:M50 family metallopeptidase [Fervidobacterium sp.]
INNMDLFSYMTNWKNEVVTIKSESGEMSGVLSSVSITPERYTIGIYYGQFSNVFAKDSEVFSKGDKLLQINGFEINSSNDLFDAVTSLTLKSDEVYVSTDGEKIDKIIRPSSSDVRVVYESKGERKEITIAKDKLIQTLSIPGVLEPQSVTLKPKGFQVVSLAFARSNRLSVYIWKSLPGIFVGRNLDEVAGPVGMVQIIGQAAQIGLETILTIVAMITINLGIFNLFPLPALDGGRIIFALIEMITRRKINRNVENWIHAIGFFLLIGLVIFITFIDVGRFFM